MATITPEAWERLSHVRLLALDVDGTLTDGTILYMESGSNSVVDNRAGKSFHIQDGLGIAMAQTVGIRFALITGRNSAAAVRRASELGIKEVRQAVSNKAVALQEVADALGVPLAQVGYMGDDVNDLPAMQIAGVALAPANAVDVVKQFVHVVTDRAGGAGAVREAIDAILRAQGEYNNAANNYLQRGGVTP